MRQHEADGIINNDRNFSSLAKNDKGFEEGVYLQVFVSKHHASL
jgi:hypothetical protein